jgi:dTDP-glucose 4,6-dehydratase
MLRYTSRGQRGCLDLLPDSLLDQVAITMGDVRDFDAVREIARGADAIFHLAALIGIPYSYEHPQEVIDTNIIGTSNVLLAAREAGTLQRIVGVRRNRSRRGWIRHRLQIAACVVLKLG